MPPAIISVVSWIFNVYELLIIVGAVLSWASQSQRSEVNYYVGRLTEPVLRPCREVMNSILQFAGVDPRRLPLDFSPVIALLFLDLVRRAAIILLGLI
jgi:uncharacterized protein YggT (Ycf19 family)